MKYHTEIDILPLKETLVSQGKAVKSSIAKPGLIEVQDVRTGKYIHLELEAGSREETCKKQLASLIMEGYAYTIHEA